MAKTSSEDRDFLTVSFPRSLLHKVDEAAKRELITRSAWLRRVAARAVEQDCGACPIELTRRT